MNSEVLEKILNAWYNSLILYWEGENMAIKTNQELADFVKKAIKASGIKKNSIAENIGLSRQGLDNLLNKKSFSLDDANKILNEISLSASVEIQSEILKIFQTDKLNKLLEEKQ